MTLIEIEAICFSVSEWQGEQSKAREEQGRKRTQKAGFANKDAAGGLQLRGLFPLEIRPKLKRDLGGENCTSLNRAGFALLTDSWQRRAAIPLRRAFDRKLFFFFP